MIQSVLLVWVQRLSTVDFCPVHSYKFNYMRDQINVRRVVQLRDWVHTVE
jgi:hypothetical protein